MFTKFAQPLVTLQAREDQMVLPPELGTPFDRDNVAL